MKIQKPTNPLELEIEHDGNTHTLLIHDFGSNEVYFAMKSLAGLESIEDEEEKRIVFCDYAAVLIAGWSDEDNVFFGEKYSPEYSKSMCRLILNQWLVNAVIGKVNDAAKSRAPNIQN